MKPLGLCILTIQLRRPCCLILGDCLLNVVFIRLQLLGRCIYCDAGRVTSRISGSHLSRIIRELVSPVSKSHIEPGAGRVSYGAGLNFSARVRVLDRIGSRTQGEAAGAKT